MYASLINLVRTLSEQSDNIRSFHYGDITFFLDSMRGRIDYPCAFMQDPIYRVTAGDSLINRAQLSILLLEDAAHDNQLHQAQIMTKLHNEAKDYIRRISIILFNQGIDIIGEVIIEPIGSVSADNLLGWDLQLTIQLDESTCIDYDIQQPFPLMFEINPVQLTYIPTISGNTDNLNKVVTASDGSVWLIDHLGRGLNLNVTAGDIEITNQAKGLVLRSDPSANPFRVGVLDDGDLTTEEL